MRFVAAKWRELLATEILLLLPTLNSHLNFFIFSSSLPFIDVCSTSIQACKVLRLSVAYRLCRK